MEEPLSKAVLVSGHLGAGNLGDELMLRGLLTLLSPSNVIVLRSRRSDWMDPRPTPPRFIGRFSTERFWRVRRPLLLCGGTHFHDERVEISRLRAILAQALLVLQLSASRLFRAEVHLVGVGIGPVRDPLTRLLGRAALKVATSVTVRDIESHAVATTLDPGREIGIVPDLATLAPELQTGPTPNHHERLLLVIPVPEPGATGRSIPAPAAVASVADRLEAQVAVLPFNRSDQNLTAARTIVEAIDGARLLAGSTTLRTVDAVDDAVEAMRGASLVISSRFHGVIAALALEIPVVAAPYHEKVAALARRAQVPLLGSSSCDELVDDVRRGTWRSSTAAGMAGIDSLRAQIAAIAS